MFFCFISKFSNSFHHRLSVTILRLPNGLDYSHLNLQIHPVFKPNDILTANSSTSNLHQLATPASSDDVSVLKPPTIAQLMPADSYLNLSTLATPNRIKTMPNAKRKFGTFFVYTQSFFLT